MKWDSGFQLPHLQQELFQEVGVWDSTLNHCTPQQSLGLRLAAPLPAWGEQQRKVTQALGPHHPLRDMAPALAWPTLTTAGS